MVAGQRQVDGGQGVAQPQPWQHPPPQGGAQQERPQVGGQGQGRAERASKGRPPGRGQHRPIGEGRQHGQAAGHGQHAERQRQRAGLVRVAHVISFAGAGRGGQLHI